MKTLNESLLDQAHLIVMAVTLVIAGVGWGAKLSHTTLKSSHTWFGYVPMSIQPSLATEHHIPATLNKQNFAKTERVRVPA